MWSWPPGPDVVTSGTQSPPRSRRALRRQRVRRALAIRFMRRHIAHMAPLPEESSAEYTWTLHFLLRAKDATVVRRYEV
jgi:hypothetical protein